MRKYIAICVLLASATFCGAQTADFRTYGGVGLDHAYDLLETEDGYFLIGTTASPFNGNTDIYILKLYDDLTVEWSRTIGGPGVDQARSVKQLSTGDLLLLSYTSLGDIGSYDAKVYRLDASDGSEIWSASFGTSDWDLTIDMDVIDDKAYLLTKSYGLPGSNGHLLMHVIDESGNLLIEETFTSPNEMDPMDLCVYQDSLYMAYSILNEDGSSDLHLDKFDSNLNLIWQTTLLATDEIHYSAGGVDVSEYGIAMAATAFSTQTEQSSERFLRFNSITGALEVEVSDLLEGQQSGEAVIWYEDVALLLCQTDATYGAGGSGALVEVRYFEGNWFNATVFGGEMDEIPEGIYQDSQGRVLIWGSTFSFGNGTEEMMLIRLPDNTINNDLEVEVTTFEDEFFTDIDEPSVFDQTFINQQGSHLSFQSSKQALWIDIYDLQGKLIASGNVSLSIDTSELGGQCVAVKFTVNNQVSSRLVLINP